MASIGDTTRPAFAYDQATDTWVPVGIGPHSHTAAGVGAVATSSFAAKGDLVAGTGAGTLSNLSVGTNGQSLVADSTTATGLKWATAGASVATPTSSGTVFGVTSSTTFNAAVGHNALLNATTAGGSVAIGENALASVTDQGYQVAIGFEALKANTTGSSNTAVGVNALNANVDGGSNTAIGGNAIGVAVSASSNVAIGDQAMSNSTGGLGNTVIGAQAGISARGNYNTVVGYNAGGYISSVNLTTGTNNIIIGKDAATSSPTINNTITFGNSSITTLRCQVTSITALSDARDKKNIEPLNVGLDFVNTLKPVTFDWNMRSTIDKDGNEIAGGKVDIPDAGFIAQDIIAAEDATGAADHLQLSYRDNPDALEITQGRLIPVLVKAIQDLSANNAALLARIEALEGAN